jgi:hypothetical protein
MAIVIADIMPRPACDKCGYCCTYDCNDPRDHCDECAVRAWIIVRDERNAQYTNSLFDEYAAEQRIREMKQRDADNAFRIFNSPSTNNDPCVNGCRCD